MASTQRLYKDMIREPRLWSLYLAPSVDSIDVMAYCPLEDHSLFTATIPLEAEAGSKALEEAVYDNPLLLNDFKHVTIVNRNEIRAVMPTEIANDTDTALSIVTEMTGYKDGTLIVDHLPLLETSIGHLIDTDTFNFLSRTFGTATSFIHRLSALTRYFHGTQRGTGSLTTHVNLRRNTFDIITFDSDKLLLANTYRWNRPDDVLYFILAVRELLSIDLPTPVALSGDRQVRAEITPLLRQYLPTVMPAVFPTAMFHAGGNAAMNAPTDLIVMPLCE